MVSKDGFIQKYDISDCSKPGASKRESIDKQCQYASCCFSKIAAPQPGKSSLTGTSKDKNSKDVGQKIYAVGRHATGATLIRCFSDGG